MRACLVCLPLLFACTAQPVQEVSRDNIELAEGLPFRIAVLPVVGEAGVSNTGADVLAASFESEVFVQARSATDLSGALRSGAELILVSEVFEAAGETGAAMLNLRFYDATFPEAWSGAYPAGQAGLALSIEAPLVEGDWQATAVGAARELRARSTGLLDSGLAPFQLDPSELRFGRRGARYELRGSVRWAADSRTQHLRSVSCTLPGGARVQAELAAPAPGSSSLGFVLDLPELAPGELLFLEVDAGSRVRYLRRYALRLL